MKILIVTSDLPSHPYATARLAKVLAHRHFVTLAAPEGTALDRCRSETEGCASIFCVGVGKSIQDRPVNARSAVDYRSWSTCWRSLRNRLHLSHMFDTILEAQDPLYEPLQQLILCGGYDVVIPIHAVAPIVCDAIESLRLANPILIFSSLPYDEGTYLAEPSSKRVWTTLPHVAVTTEKTFGCWNRLDRWLTDRAIKHMELRNNARRARRGLEPLPGAYFGYMRRYPVLCLGGMGAFFGEGKVAPNVTTLGALDALEDKEIGDDSLETWLESDLKRPLVYASFGTATELCQSEVENLVRAVDQCRTGIRLLISLRESEQLRLLPVINRTLRESPSRDSPESLVYQGGRIRVQTDVPQERLLRSGYVHVFISHMGMGSYTEAMMGAVPLIAYPTGADQYYNMARAVEAGVAVPANHRLRGLGEQLDKVFSRDDLREASRLASIELQEYGSNQRAIWAVEGLVASHRRNRPSQA